MARGNTRYRQRTMTVSGYGKVTIRSRIRTRGGNHAGFNVDINGKRYFVNAIERDKAESYAYAKWVQEVAPALPDPTNRKQQ